MVHKSKRSPRRSPKKSRSPRRSPKKSRSPRRSPKKSAHRSPKRSARLSPYQKFVKTHMGKPGTRDMAAVAKKWKHYC